MLDDINNIKKDVFEYIEVKLDLLRLHTAENLSRLFSNVATTAVAGYLLFMIIIFLSFAAGFFIGSLLNSVESGFLCVGAFYLMLLILFLMLRKRIVERPIIKSMVRLFFPKFEDDEKK
jgi:sterol desaturase/sphingolipid hydroxylase (fatty acid hydroxylase superfamily)